MIDIKHVSLCILIFIGGVNLLLFDGKPLSSNVQPDSYILNFVINDERAIFTGNVSMTLRVVNVTDNIRLHARDISVSWRAAILNNTDRNFAVTEVNPLNNDIVELKCGENLPVGIYQLQLSFFGEIRQTREGLYSTPNSGQGAIERATIATNFYPNMARNVFPCFDDPELRAKFRLNIYHDRSLTAISNMPIDERTGPHADYNGLMLSKFPESIRMPTYSFGFIIGQYVGYAIENQRVHIYAPTAKNISNAMWYYQKAAKLLDRMEIYLGSPFQWPKLHVVAVSNDHELGINLWGVIRVPQKYMYYDSTRDRDVIIDDHQDGISYIANQIARSWFANSITPKSAWMADGFAKYLEYLICAQIVPQWRLLDQFLVRENHVALAADASLSAQPLTAEVGAASANLKAGGIIRMLEGAFGSDVLKKIIRQYVAKKSGSVATSDDLFAIINAEVSNTTTKLPTTVKNMIENWTNNAGYPIIKLTRHYGDASKVNIVQKRFISDVDVNRTGNEVWPQQYIPVTLSTRDSLDFNETVPALWLTPIAPSEPNVSYTMQPPVQPGSWIIVNNQQSGFYRVNYDRTNWNLLMNALARNNFDMIPVLNRAQLIDDAFNLAQSGERSFDLAFSIISYLREESDFIPWKTATRSLSMLDRMLGGQESHKLLERFIQNITSNAFDLTPVMRNETNHVLRLQRRDISRLACKAGLPACIAEVNTAFPHVLQDSSLVMPEMQEIVFCTAAKFSSNPNKLAQSIVRYVINAYQVQGASSKDELYRVFAGLGCLQDEALLIRYLELTTAVLPTGFKVDLTKNDRQLIYTSIIRGSYIGTKACLEYLRRNFATVELRFESMARLLYDFGPYLVSEELKTKYNSMLEQHKTKLTEPMRLAAAYSLADADRNLKWGKLNQASIAKWLRENMAVENAPASGTLRLINVLTVFMSLSILYAIQ